jgi:hypothetical protein
MAGLCIECERLWKEYSAAMHEYLGLNRAANGGGASRDRGVGPLSIGLEPESQPALAAMKAWILQHEYAAHPEAMQRARQSLSMHRPRVLCSSGPCNECGQRKRDVLCNYLVNSLIARA